MKQCVFCQIVAGTLDSSAVYDDGPFLAFMDIYPWRPGHVLIIPKQHSQRVSGIRAADAEQMFGLALRIAAALRVSRLPCDDVHFLLNDGRAANQSVPHVHMHVVPRCKGDLWRLTGQLLKRPIVPLLRPARRERLDRQAAAIRDALSTE